MKHKISPRKSTLSRRELLKILAAGGGELAATAFLPEKWLKPVVETGVLPAHAQATDGLRIVELDVHPRERQDSKPSTSTEGCPDVSYYGVVHFIDDLCRINIDHTDAIGSATPFGIKNWVTGYPIGDACKGAMEFTFKACPGQVFTIVIQVGKRESPPVNAEI